MAVSVGVAVAVAVVVAVAVTVVVDVAVGLFVFGATIGTHQESQWSPLYTTFYLYFEVLLNARMHTLVWGLFLSFKA